MLKNPKKKTTGKAKRRKNPDNSQEEKENFANWLRKTRNELYKESAKLKLSSSIVNDIIEIEYMIEGVIINLLKK